MWQLWNVTWNSFSFSMTLKKDRFFLFTFVVTEGEVCWVDRNTKRTNNGSPSQQRFLKVNLPKLSSWVKPQHKKRNYRTCVGVKLDKSLWLCKQYRHSYTTRVHEKAASFSLIVSIYRIWLKGFNTTQEMVRPKKAFYFKVICI